jgi:pimeloyl-ACP methyl ester carboxylesterase
MELRADGKRAFAGTGGRSFDASLPTVVLLHGAGMDHSVWAAQARSLAHHGRNVLAFDLPGHGLSDGPALGDIGAMADWVLRALAAHGVARFRLAGHSMGALVALEAAARAGDGAEALALLGVVPEMRVHPDLLASARAGAHTAIDFMVSWSFGRIGRLGGNPAPGLWLAGGALRLLERAPAASLAADLAACAAYDGAATAAARVRCPTLLLLGAEDRMTPARHGAAFAERFAAPRVAVLPGVGHMMMLEDPVATLDALKGVL